MVKATGTDAPKKSTKISAKSKLIISVRLRNSKKPKQKR